MLFNPFKSQMMPQSGIPQMDGMPNPLSTHDAVIGSLMKLGNKEGDEPKPKGKEVYKTQSEVDADNIEARAFAKRHHMVDIPYWLAQKAGDPKVPVTNGLTGNPYNPMSDVRTMPASMIKHSVPDWVTELQFNPDWQMPYYLDGNDMVYVDKSFYNSPRFLKNKK